MGGGAYPAAPSSGYPAAGGYPATGGYAAPGGYPGAPQPGGAPSYPGGELWVEEFDGLGLLQGFPFFPLSFFFLLVLYEIRIACFLP